MRIAGEFRQQQSVGHEHQARGVGHLIREAHPESHAAADALPQFLGDTRRQGARRDSSRLRVGDQPGAAAAEFEAVLRQLRALAGTGVAGDDEHLLRRAAPAGWPRGAPKSADRDRA